MTALRIILRVLAFIVQLPLWVTACPVLMAGMLDDYDGDRLWLPAIGTLMMIALPFILLALLAEMVWETVRGY